MKLREYTPSKFLRFVFVCIEVDGKRYMLEEALEEIPDHDISEEFIRGEEEYAFEEFFQEIELLETEKKIKEYIFEVTEPQDDTETRRSNILLLFELFDENPHCIEDAKRNIMNRWAKKFLVDVNPESKTGSSYHNNIVSSRNNGFAVIDKKRGAKYARLHYNEIKKILAVTGIITDAVRQFDPTLSDAEVERIRHKVSILLKEEGLVYPYRQ